MNVAQVVRRTVALGAAAGALLGVTSPARAQDPGPGGRAYACWQTFANYAPNGRLSGFNRATRGVLHLYATELPVYEVSNADGFVPKRSARTGLWSWDGREIRFTSGPYHQPRARWDLAGTYHPDGVRMPHDLKRGRRYQIVLRSIMRRPADDAPPRHEGVDFIITYWYCRAQG